LGIEALHYNPYDGHTLESILNQVKENFSWEPKRGSCRDLGYRGHGYKGESEIKVVNYRSSKKETRWARKWIRRRAAIEPIFSHLKLDNHLYWNYLKGKEGDNINALLSGCGFNMRKLLKAFFLPIFIINYEEIKFLIKNWCWHEKCFLLLNYGEIA